jgi:hypothetical protein
MVAFIRLLILFVIAALVVPALSTVCVSNLGL